MRQQYILKYFISSSIVMLLFCVSVHAQNDSIIKPINESTKIKQKYGIRLGGDFSKIVRTLIDEDYKGFEIQGDFRLTNKWYLAGEIGAEEKTGSNDFLNATAKGTYFKVGSDYNFYKNWFGMENMIYGGLRIGFSTFSQTLNSFGIYSQNQYWAPQFTSDIAQEFSGLTALWSEIIIGLKAELLNNLYIGVNIQFKGMINQDQPENFENLYVPGFNRTHDSGRFGFGYSYNISYLIPLYKKEK